MTQEWGTVDFHYPYDRAPFPPLLDGARGRSLPPWLRTPCSTTGRANGGSYCRNDELGRTRDVLRFEFTGPLVGVIHGDSARGGRATVSIDGEQKRNLTFTGDRRRIRFGQKLIYRRLGPSSHTIRIVMLDDSQGFVECFTMRH